MIQNYNGTSVVGPDGNQIGSVERTYDDADGNAQFVEVKIGTLLAKHRLVPVSGLAPDGDGLQIPYDKETVEASPNASDAGDTLNGDLLVAARQYYDGLASSDAVGDDDAASETDDSEATGAVPADA